MKKVIPYAEAFPLFMWMLLFALIPLIFIFVLSFCQTTPSGGVLFKFTMNNYKRILEPVYLKIFLLSLKTAFITSCITLFIGYPFAYFTFFYFKRYRSLIILLVIIPFWSSSLLRTYGFIILFRGGGLLNTLLLSLGVINEPVKFLYSYPSVIFGMSYMLLPFMIIPVYNSVGNLDYSIVEAARDLGASKTRAFFTVTVPLTLSGILGGFSLVFIPAAGLFFISDLLGGGKIMMLGNLIQNQILTVRNYPFGAALSVIMLICVLTFVFLYKKLLKEGAPYY